MTSRHWPPYTHIPGVTPHPIRDPAGHSFQSLHFMPVSDFPTSLTWQSLLLDPEFQWGVQLFNRGYYWEAHEAWEALWHRAGRSGELADFLKGLIKLAAAGVKLREHNVAGVERHARRALELLRSIEAADIAVEQPALVELANSLLHPPPTLPEDCTGRPVVALGLLPLSFTVSLGP